MKINNEKICQDKDCENNFTQYKSTDKYCSYSCRVKNESKKNNKKVVRSYKKKEFNCANVDCENTFVKYKSTDKYCSSKCKPVKSKKVVVTIKKVVEERECKAEDCENVFIQYKSTDKYCSLTCEIKQLKEKVESYESFKSKQIKKKKIKSNIFDKEFAKSKKILKDSIIEEHGHLICQKCTATSSIQFSTHHIVFRSELPKHIELNNIRNLIHLCYDCHESFHQNKKSRNYLITERNLTELFGSLWGYFKEDENLEE